MFDFTGIDATADKPQQDVKEQAGNKKLQAEWDYQSRANEGAAEAYKRWQENTRKTELLQAEILKGVAAGESTTQLFLKAAEAIALMTDNELFYRQIKNQIQSR